MAQVIVTLCDLCDDGARGEPMVVTLGEKGPTRIVDMCDAHREALIEPLRVVLADHGRRLPDVGRMTPVAADSFPCIVCAYEGPTASATSQHYKVRHDLRSVAAVYGSSHQCYVCAGSFETAQGLATHATKAHDEEGAHGLYRLALASGDPHDLIAKRRAELGVAA